MRTQATTEAHEQTRPLSPVVLRIRASLPTSCCGREPPELEVATTGQLMHVLCGICLRHHGVFTTFELRIHFDYERRPIAIDGVKRSLSEWCAITGVPEARALYRIYNGGWAPARAVSQPVREYGDRPTRTKCRG